MFAVLMPGDRVQDGGVPGLVCFAVLSMNYRFIRDNPVASSPPNVQF
jgi:hypothetical protein